MLAFKNCAVGLNKKCRTAVGRGGRLAEQWVVRSTVEHTPPKGGI
eukprot:IDg18381t1